MPFWRKNVFGVVVINDIPDENDDVHLTSSDVEHKKHKKDDKPQPPPEDYDPMDDFRRGTMTII